MDRPVRVLVVEDSPTVCHRLCDVLAADPGIEVAGAAHSGLAAIDATRRLAPDVITMDIMLAGMSGLAATEQIMAHQPTPILVVSSADNRSELFTTYDALAAGAVDVLDKPRGDATDADWERRLCAAVKLVSRVAVITHPRAKLTRLRTGPARTAPGVPAGPAGTAGPAPSVPAGPAGPAGRRQCDLVAIGASTGGPGALVEVLRALPEDFAPPVLLVQHIGSAFAGTFVDWLDSQIRQTTTCARDGEPIAAVAGRVIMAPGDRHLSVRAGRLRLTDGPERHSCRPSVDTLFESVAADCGGAAIGVLLTGMGRDGAAGLLAMRRAGAWTIAQDQATSVVYGMPREAVQLGGADEVLSVGDIGHRLAGLAASRPISARLP
jgi:two-component system, chemotaxis family, protein-glutamate methylesterase/glutaminase